jgi:cytochrome c-type biogenesis protein
VILFLVAAGSSRHFLRRPTKVNEYEKIAVYDDPGTAKPTQASNPSGGARQKLMQVSVVAAFIAGVVSFLSPCVLPLVPGYISMLSGIGVDQLRQGEQPRSSLLGSSLAFVVGFSVVFVAFGASASAVGQFLVHNRTLLAPLAGALILLFGLHLVGWLSRISVRAGLAVGLALVALAALTNLRPALLGARLEPIQLGALSVIFFLGPFLTRWLNRDVHFRNLGGDPGLLSGFLLGFAFAFGWTPCIGPILAGVLALAAASETIARGILLLAVYSAGLAIPFLLTAVGIGSFLRFYQRFRRHLHAVEVSSGVLLLFVGGLVFVNRLTWLSGKLTFLNRFAW